MKIEILNWWRFELPYRAQCAWKAVTGFEREFFVVSIPRLHAYEWDADDEVRGYGVIVGCVGCCSLESRS